MLSVVVVLALVVTLAFVGTADQWPAVESPPRQGEALDERALERGEFSHSPLAVGRLIREPQNTWSNLAFIFAGACLTRVPHVAACESLCGRSAGCCGRRQLSLSCFGITLVTSFGRWGDVRSVLRDDRPSVR